MGKLSTTEARSLVEKAKLSPLHGKHGKRKATLLKEEAYKEMIKGYLSVADELVKEQLRIATLKSNDPRYMALKLKAIDSVLDRAFGKPNKVVEPDPEKQQVIINMVQYGSPKYHETESLINSIKTE